MVVWADAPAWLIGTLNLLLLLIGLFLILLILIQRGKGGGLAGAFGGAGGSSAFGSRAGDAFTRVTIIVAAIWLLLIMLIIKLVQPAPLSTDRPTPVESIPAERDDRGREASEVRVLSSMTGYGEASYESDALQIAVELRAVNNRYLKVVLRAAEPYNLLESEIEKVIRRAVRRGTIQVHLRCRRSIAAHDFQINAVALRSYVSQLRPLLKELELPDGGQSVLSQVLTLPGVVPEPAATGVHLDADWPVFERVLEQALSRLQTMRLEEGRAMAREFLALRDQIAAELEQIRALTPRVAAAYRDRLLERVRGLVAELDVRIDRADLIKEVSVFAERSDVAEEVVRLASHLDQFGEVLREPESAGRKLEFLTQEMFREVNTIGSKGSDVDISRHVVEIKGALEKIRELVQNVE
jgi:protein translocase SecG subunit